MKIESIVVKNYKVFRNMKVENLSDFAVFLGTNGSGKSTLFDIFSFLRDALQDNVTIALSKRGGFKEVISRGADAENEKIEIEIIFKENIKGVLKTPRVSYKISIAEKSGKGIIEEEELKQEQFKIPGMLPWSTVLEFKRGIGWAIVEGDKIEDQNLASSDILAIKGFGQFEQYSKISSIRSLFEKWYTSDFKIDSAKVIRDAGISEHLSMTGDNLAQTTKYMYDYHREIFEQILQKLPRRIPGLSKVEAKVTEDGRIVLKFQDESFADPFYSGFVSDGTLKMFAYMILLHDPEPHPLLCIEEPENYLHPDLLLELAEEIREYSERGGQVLVSTHSPDFVNGIRIEELFFLEKKKGYSTIHSVGEDTLVSDLYKAGNQLGWLWRNHYIKGANLE